MAVTDYDELLAELVAEAVRDGMGEAEALAAVRAELERRGVLPRPPGGEQPR